VGDEQVDIRIDSSADIIPTTTIAVPDKRVDRGSDRRMAIAGDGGSASTNPDPVLVKLIVLGSVFI
jgi:hypothetical protein